MGSRPEAFGQQATSILGTNYWGLKNVINGLQDIFTPGARLVNMSSHLGHLSMINGEAKVAVNTYTKILQRRFDEEGNGVVVNSIHPGTKHSKIHQASNISMEDGAYAVANCACVPDKGGFKGSILWHNMTPILWEDGVHKPSLVNNASQNHH